MSMRRNLTAFARDRQGSTLIEFALLAPLLLGAMFGVLQIGRGMRDYNSMRSVAAETARYAVTNYQGNNPVSLTAIENFGVSTAKAAPYSLAASDISVSVSRPLVQRIAGVTELSVTVTYITASQMKILNIAEPFTVTFTRPIFVKA